jgi:CDP-2,3-bis-(O-geranylgeranyl)-sn-glycerol synthase
MLHNFFIAFWFMIPAAVANVVPILSAAAPGLRHLNAPIDAGIQFRGRSLLGHHKTWRGLISGVIAGALVFWLQQILVRHYTSGPADAGDLGYMYGYPYLGALLGFGALAGDAIKSFFKRQRGIDSGKSWLPFDQLDYIIGAVLISLPFVTLTVWQYVWIFVIWFVMHLVMSYVGYLLHLKDSPI